MFTPSELYSIAHKCPNDLKALLDEVGITMADVSEDLDVYRKLDEDLTQKIRELLKCSQPVEGYFHLLDLAKIPYKFSETAKELTAKIVANSDQIRIAATSPRISK